MVNNNLQRTAKKNAPHLKSFKNFVDEPWRKKKSLKNMRVRICYFVMSDVGVCVCVLHEIRFL